MSSAAGSLAQDMLLAFRDQQLSDITVMAFGQTFHLHRLILLRSGYFRSLILGQGDWIEKSRQAITIQFDDPYVTLQSFQRIVHWLYGIDFHYTEGNAPLTFRGTPAAGRASIPRPHSTQPLERVPHSPFNASDSGRHGLGLRQGGGEPLVNSEKSFISGTSGAVSFRQYDSIMMDPSDKVDELLISMYAAASYLNITALTEEICSDIAHRIRDSRGLIHYMEYAWKLNNGRAWDIILAHCFYQFFWYTYKSLVLQGMLVSPDMPIAGLVKTLISESLWVPNEFERYQLVKGIMLRRLDLDNDKVLNWVYDYHSEDWFGILKELDDNGTWSHDMSSDTFLNNLQDWESNSTTEYEDAVDSDHEWVTTTTKELRRRSSQISTSKLGMEDIRNAKLTAEIPSMNLDSDRTSEPEGNADTTAEEIVAPETSVAPHSPTLGTPISSPALSALSVTSDTLPRHQLRDLLILMYILHHSIHYTHMAFDQLHQILSDGLVLPARIKDAFWRQHLLRRIAVSSSPALPYATSPSVPPRKRHHGSADAASRDKGSQRGGTGASRAKMSSSASDSPPPASSSPINSHGLLPIRFSTSLYISRRDLMTDGKHFTSSTFYGGSWWSIQVGNNLNSDGQVGVFLSAAPAPRAVPNSGGRANGRSPIRYNPATGILAALRGDQQTTTSTTGQFPRRVVTAPAQPVGATENSGGNGENTSVYNRQRDLACSYRIYMTTNVIEPLQYFAATAAGRLEEIRGSEYHYHNPGNDAFGAGGDGGRSGFATAAEGGHSAASTPDLSSTSSTFVRPSQKIAAEDEMIGEDTFKLTEGWGYRCRKYLTRVARQVRDQPPKSSQGLSSSYQQEGTHGSMPAVLGGQAQGGGHLQQQQQQQQQHHLQQQFQQLQQQQQQQPHQQQQQQLQQQHGQAANAGQFPLAGQNPVAAPQPNAVPLQLNANVANAGQPGQAGQHQQQAWINVNNGQAANNVNANANANAGQGHGAQAQTQHEGNGGGGSHQPLGGSPSLRHGTITEESEDDGLWIHFVVKVGWSDGKRNDDKAAS
ncbi:hypothetical protein BGZ99_005838 [Dissophora globulifera]|uniref:BTB domain-containing protein n=1 Tax=Dissophora globulifera TaxID=979702 RepID=A0A9P6RHY4_9FUNG|nr:hypothetical protein BGZ99_005838 [Dissophora globulifera]